LHNEIFETQINTKKPRKNPGFELFLILRRSKDQRRHKKSREKISALYYSFRNATSLSGDIAEKTVYS
jgi:hypothetical protein